MEARKDARTHGWYWWKGHTLVRAPEGLGQRPHLVVVARQHSFEAGDVFLPAGLLGAAFVGGDERAHLLRSDSPLWLLVGVYLLPNRALVTRIAVVVVLQADSVLVCSTRTQAVSQH